MLALLRKVMFWALLCVYINPVATLAPQVNSAVYVKDTDCEYFNQSEVSREVVAFASVSHVDCTRLCAQHYNCEGLRSIVYNNDTFGCQVMLSNTTSQSQSKHGYSSLNTSSAKIVLCFKLDMTRGTIYESGTKPEHNNEQKMTISPEENLPHCCMDSCPDMSQNHWVPLVDTASPETQLTDYITTKEDSSLDESKVLIEDGNPKVFYSITCNEVSFSKIGLKAVSVYTMNKNMHYFLENETSTLMAYTFSSNGNSYVGLRHPNGETGIKTMDYRRMKILVQDPSEYCITIEASEKHIDPLINMLEKGYKIQGYTYAVINRSSSVVTMFAIDKIIGNKVTGKPNVPFRFRQRLFAFPDFVQDIKVQIMHPRGKYEDPITLPSHSVFLSPLWEPALGKDLQDGREVGLHVLSRLMYEGHAFRVAFNDRIFDVDAVIKLGNEMYVLLPQQVEIPDSRYFTNNLYGVRAILSSSGEYQWCSHVLKYELALGKGSEKGIVPEYFTDKKYRTVALSVFSNGSVVDGSVADVAEAAMVGNDMNILIEWLREEKAILYKVRMVTITDYERPSVLVSAETQVTWNLTPSNNGTIFMNDHCHMEKLLVKTDGQVDKLIYNLDTRLPVSTISDVRCTWFKHQW